MVQAEVQAEVQGEVQRPALGRAPQGQGHWPASRAGMGPVADAGEGGTVGLGTAGGAEGGRP